MLLSGQLADQPLQCLARGALQSGLPLHVSFKLHQPRLLHHAILVPAQHLLQRLDPLLHPHQRRIVQRQLEKLKQVAQFLAADAQAMDLLIGGCCIHFPALGQQLGIESGNTLQRVAAHLGSRQGKPRSGGHRRQQETTVACHPPTGVGGVQKLREPGILGISVPFQKQPKRREGGLHRLGQTFLKLRQLQEIDVHIARRARLRTADLEKCGPAPAGGLR